MAPARRVQLQEALKLALSVTLFYWLALSLNWPSPKNGVIAIAVTSLATVGESLNKGLLRILGTAFGVAAGLVILTGFAQNRWGFMLAMAAYAVAVSYVLLGSRHRYAWFLAGMTAAVVWSSSYLNVENAFEVGLFRFVETAGGVAVYTIVSLVLWPRSAGKQVDDAGRRILEGLRELFRRERTEGGPPEGTAELRASVAGSLPQLGKVLDAAFSDTPSIRARKGAWRALPTDVRSFGDALQFHRLSIEDSRELDLDRWLPDRDADLDTIERRLDRVVDLWNTRDAPAADDDGELLSPLRLAVSDAADLSHGDRARLMNHVHELRKEPAPEPRSAADRASRWDPERLLQALFPALCFVVAYLFWVYTAPPAGSGLPIIGIVFGMLLILMPMNLFKILKLLLLGIAAVSPLYMFVLPRLESGAALLALAFASTFLLGLLGGRLAILRTLGLVCFALITNITNRQGYYFLGVLYPAIMLFLGTVVVMAVYWFLSPMHPEKVVLRSLRRFYRGCARLMRGFAGNQPPERDLRRRSFRFQILPASQRLRAAQQSIDYERFPGNTPESVQRLAGAMQVLILRLQALERAFHRSADHPVEVGRSLTELRVTLEGVFRQWARAAGIPALDEQRATLDRLSRALRDELDQLVESDRFDEEALRDFWAVLGGLRGLMETMAEIQNAMREIRWEQWAVARF
ncbi:MAG: FUSC family protein [Planctomycetota bacterium]|jgi:uncharacterized membrane protein YccC